MIYAFTFSYHLQPPVVNINSCKFFFCLTNPKLSVYVSVLILLCICNNRHCSHPRFWRPQKPGWLFNSEWLALVFWTNKDLSGRLMESKENRQFAFNNTSWYYLTTSGFLTAFPTELRFHGLIIFFCTKQYIELKTYKRILRSKWSVCCWDEFILHNIKYSNI